MTDSLSISGGALPAGIGPVTVNTVVMLEMSRRFGFSAARTTEVGAELTLLAGNPALIAAAVLDPVGAARVHHAIRQAGLGAHGLTSAAVQLTRHAASLASAAARYEINEGRVRRHFEGANAWIDDALVRLTGTGTRLGVLIGGGGLLLRNGVNELGEAAWSVLKMDGKGAVNNITDFGVKSAEIVTSALPGTVPLFGDVRKISKGVNSALEFAGAGTSAYRLQVTAGRQEVPVQLKPGLAGTFAGLDAVCEPASRDTVTTVRLTRPGQPDRYIIGIPGTNSWTDDTKVFNGKSNVQLKARELSDPERLAEAAMAGIPPGSEVVLTGYSQGGIVAANLAARAAVRNRYTVRGVVTVGSPTGDVIGKSVPRTVPVMSIEHADDPVPTLDGRRALPGATRYVVRTDSPDLPINSSLKPHSYTLYRHTVDRVAVSRDPSARALQEALKDFQASPGTTATMSEFHGARVKKTG